MPQTAHESAAAGSRGLPAWVTSGALGLTLGAGGMLMGIQYYHPELNVKKTTPAAAESSQSSGAPAAPGGGMMGGGMPGGMMGGGMGGGMMGGGGGKRALTMLVGKLELLSRPELKLNIQLDPEQSKAIAAKLKDMETSESMTADEAQANVDTLEELLTAEQKETLGLIGLPQGRGGGGGRGGPGGRGGAPGAGGGASPPNPGGAHAGPPPTSPANSGGGGGGMGGMGGGNPNENPFAQEAAQKRLHDLLFRLNPEAASTAEKKDAEKKE